MAPTEIAATMHRVHMNYTHGAPVAGWVVYSGLQKLRWLKMVYYHFHVTVGPAKVPGRLSQAL